MAENISPLVLEQYLANGDDRFLPALREFHDPKKLIPMSSAGSATTGRGRGSRSSITSTCR